MDQYRAWRVLDRWLPDDWLGNGGPLQHRGVTHWWGTVVAQAVTWATLLAYLPDVARPVVWPIAVGQVVGWVSHLLLDWVYGLQVRAPDGAVIVRAGIPMAPWWAHRGGFWRSSDIGSQTAGILLSVTSAMIGVGLLYLTAR